MCIKLNPKDEIAYQYRGSVYLKIGERLKGIQDYDTAVSLKPKDYDVYKSRGNAYEEMGELQKAL